MIDVCIKETLRACWWGVVIIRLCETRQNKTSELWAWEFYIFIQINVICFCDFCGYIPVNNLTREVRYTFASWWSHSAASSLEILFSLLHETYSPKLMQICLNSEVTLGSLFHKCDAHASSCIQPCGHVPQPTHEQPHLYVK
jgi:hypothetical protein